MSEENLPKHFKFQDKKQGEIAFIQAGDWTGWLFKRHPDGQWVSMRLATKEDMEKVSRTMALLN